MKKWIISIIAICMFLSLAGCSQYNARKFGGDYTHKLPQGEKLINLTWKEDSLWYLTKPMEEDDVAETYKFQADSLFGIFEGTVTVEESK